MLRVVAQWGYFGVARIHLAMIFPGQKSIFHRLPNLRELLGQAICLTRIILLKKAERIHRQKQQAFQKVLREHRP